MLRLRLVASLAAAILSCATWADAICEEVPATKAAGVVSKTNVPELPAFTPERETASLDFVRRHHPELSAVLEQLKGLKRDEYEQAIREIAGTTERLAMLKAVDETFHGLSLEAWKIDSQIKLLAARLAFAAKHDAAIENELKQLLYQQADLQRRHVEHNRDKALASLETMNANIKLLADKRDEFVERRLQKLIHATRPSGKSSPQPTASAGAQSPKLQRSDKGSTDQ